MKSLATSIRIFLCLAFLSALVPLTGQDRRGLEVAAQGIGADRAMVGRQIVALIAIDRYEEWLPLKNPVKDARGIKAILSQRYWVDQFEELYDDSATKAGILRLFEKLVLTTRPEDSVFIYYAGHGHLDEISETGFWIPVDAGTDRYEQKNWIPNNQIRSLIGRMKARHIALASDSCFSGDILNPSRGATPQITDEYFRNAYARISRQVLTSGASETVPDDSPFSKQLRLALEGNVRPYLDPLMLFSEIRLGVRGTTPLFGSLVDSGHQEGGSFLFFLKREQPALPSKVEPLAAAASVKAAPAQVAPVAALPKAQPVPAPPVPAPATPVSAVAEGRAAGDPPGYFRVPWAPEGASFTLEPAGKDGERREVILESEAMGLRSPALEPGAYRVLVSGPYTAALDYLVKPGVGEELPGYREAMLEGIGAAKAAAEKRIAARDRRDKAAKICIWTGICAPAVGVASYFIGKAVYAGYEAAQLTADAEAARVGLVVCGSLLPLSATATVGGLVLAPILRAGPKRGALEDSLRRLDGEIEELGEMAK